MEKIKKIFVVINPATNDQYALKRAAEIAKRRKSQIIAHLCVYSDIETSDHDALKEVVIERHNLWIDKHLKSIRNMGVKVKSEIVWDKDWQEEIGVAAKNNNPDLIVKDSKRNLKIRTLKMLSSDWKLFENATCPVLLANSDSKDTGKILCAADINRTDKKYMAIMDIVLSRSKSIAEARKSELHVVNAYTEQEDYVHVADVAKKVGIPSKNVHVVGGQPEQVIVQVAGEVNAEMVIIGLSARSKLRNRIFGYTSEWLLNNLHQDVYVIIPKNT
jgi:universal stress protein E